MDIANHVKIPGRSDPNANTFKLVCDWLRDEKIERWLLVLDNVDEIDNLHTEGSSQQREMVDNSGRRDWQSLLAYLPPSENGQFLITSRSKGVALKLVEDYEILFVGPMAGSDASMLLRSKLGELADDSGISDLAAALDFMPLAIVQAAAHITQRAPRYSLQQYLEDFLKSDRKKLRLLDSEGGNLRRDPEAKSSIITTWQISFEHIRHMQPSAAGILSLMSFFDRQGIPEDLLKYSRKDTNKGKATDVDSESDENYIFEKDIQILRNYSFITIETNGSFEMHALVQLATRKWLEIHGDPGRWKGTFVERLSATFPSGDFETWAKCQSLFPHAKSAYKQRPTEREQLMQWASLMNKAAWYQTQNCNDTEAEPLAIAAAETRRDLLGQEHRDTLTSLSTVGQVYSRQGQYSRAEKLQAQLLELSNQNLGADHGDTLECMQDLAITYSEQGQWLKAKNLQVQALESSKRINGIEHPTTMNYMASLARTLRRQGYNDQAKALLLQELESRQRVSGSEHPDTVAAKSSLASILGIQGHLREAEKLEKERLEFSSRILGVDHPETLNSMGKLAWIMHDQGRLDEAEKLHRRALEKCTNVLGSEHPDTLVSKANLATLLTDLKRLDEAEEMQKQCLELDKKVLGSEHPDTLISMNNLALTWRDQGRVPEAIELLEECVRLQTKIIGADHPYCKNSAADLARWKSEYETTGSVV